MGPPVGPPVGVVFSRELYKGSDSARAQLGKFFADFISEMSEINA